MIRNDAAFSIACKLLGRRSMSLLELYNALIAKDIAPENAALACARAKELGLCDDLEYARILVRRYTSRMQGKNAIRVRLKAHGIDKSEIETALIDWEPDSDGLLHLLSARLDGETDYKAIQRGSAMLYRRGFSGEEIRDAIAMYITSVHSDMEDETPDDF